MTNYAQKLQAALAYLGKHYVLHPNSEYNPRAKKALRNPRQDYLANPAQLVLFGQGDRQNEAG
jgi:hypothetical protein